MAVGAVVLFAFAPFAVFMAGSHMNHVPTLMWLMLAMAAMARVMSSDAAATGIRVRERRRVRLRRDDPSGRRVRVRPAGRRVVCGQRVRQPRAVALTRSRPASAWRFRSQR